MHSERPSSNLVRLAVKSPQAPPFFSCESQASRYHQSSSVLIKVTGVPSGVAIPIAVAGCTAVSVMIGTAVDVRDAVNAHSAVSICAAVALGATATTHAAITAHLATPIPTGRPTLELSLRR